MSRLFIAAALAAALLSPASAVAKLPKTGKITPDE
jgi:hypothetical protein